MLKSRSCISVSADPSDPRIENAVPPPDPYECSPASHMGSSLRSDYERVLYLQKKLTYLEHILTARERRELDWYAGKVAETFTEIRHGFKEYSHCSSTTANSLKAKH
jgi:hypothetical protein